MFDREEFERWQKQSRHTLQSAENDERHRDYNWACFKAQQAAEYSVKGLLYGIGVMAFGHSVVNLLGRVQDKIAVPDKIVSQARLLDRYYIPPRYPDAHPEGAPFEYYDLKTAAEAIKTAKSLLGFVDREAQKWQLSPTTKKSRNTSKEPKNG